ncbi:MAG TPA: tetratricopeptide repeat protein [Candidatus Limnocylindrales bacterium]|nr:tetratricopeptide repeat protein [Candidatus Limnocylindrales bacterium]
MNRPSKAPRLFRFGVFQADLDNVLLTRKGIRVSLQEQPFRILAMLLERSGQIVSRDELRQELWPTGTYVDFDGSLNAALKRLRTALDDDADNPRFIETVPKRGYRFIAPVTVAAPESVESTGVAAAEAQPEPEHEPASALQLPPSAVGVDRTSPRWWVRHRLSAVIILILLVAVAVMAVLRRNGPRTPPVHASLNPATHRRSVAVIGFHNASGRPSDAWLSTALTEMLRTELSAGDTLRVVSGEDVEQFRMTSPWSVSDSLSAETTSKIGKALDSDLLVLGSYATVGDPKTGEVRVDFRLQNAQNGEILYEGAESGSEQQFFGLVAKVGVALRERLGLPFVTESEEVGVLSSLPSNPEADRFYSLGLQKMRVGDLATAKDLFLQAERLAPDFPLVHLMLSRAWGGLGYDQNSAAEAKKAFDESASLPEADKLLVEGTYYGPKDPDKAIAAYRALFALYPDNVDYGELLIVALNAASRREEALAVVKQLRQLPPPTSDDPRIDFWEGKITSYNNGPTARPLFDKAAAEAAARGQRLLYAHFRLEQCLSRVYGDNPQTAIALCQEAYQIFAAAGNRLEAADALRIMGDRHGSEGDFDGAVNLYEQALAILRQLGEHEKTGAALNNMAVALENEGQFDRAQGLFREAQKNFEECGDKLNVATAFGNIGDILLERGDLRAAEKQYQQAMETLRVVQPQGVSYDLYSIAQVRLLEGDLREAQNHADQAVAVSRSGGSPADIAASSTVLGDILSEEGDLAGARAKHEEALAMREKIGDKSLALESRAELAALDIEENKAAAADAALRDALAGFQSSKALMDEIHARTDLARVLLLESKPDDAQKMIAAATDLSRTVHDPSLKLPLAIQDARVKAARIAADSGRKPDFTEPRRELDGVVLTAKKLGYYGVECDGRLALGELELHVNPQAARSQLAQLADETHDRGLELVSRKAAALAKSAPASTASQPK